MEEHHPPADSPAGRLRACRIKAGHGTMKGAAKAFGFPVSSYTQHESGLRAFPARTAERYASAYGVTPAWLVWGDGGGS
jgi:hypothetical protein